MRQECNVDELVYKKEKVVNGRPAVSEVPIDVRDYLTEWLEEDLWV